MPLQECAVKRGHILHIKLDADNSIAFPFRFICGIDFEWYLRIPVPSPCKLRKQLCVCENPLIISLFPFSVYFQS